MDRPGPGADKYLKSKAWEQLEEYPSFRGILGFGGSSGTHFHGGVSMLDLYDGTRSREGNGRSAPIPDSLPSISLDFLMWSVSQQLG